MPVANACHTAAIVPGARLRVLEDVGHISLLTRTVEATSELLTRDVAAWRNHG
jgi:hypothetical protein